MTVDEQFERASILLDLDVVSEPLHALAGDLANEWEREGIEWNQQTLRAMVYGFSIAAGAGHARGVCLCPEELATAAQALAATRMLQPAPEVVTDDRG